LPLTNYVKEEARFRSALLDSGFEFVLASVYLAGQWQSSKLRAEPWMGSSTFLHAFSSFVQQQRYLFPSPKNLRFAFALALTSGRSVMSKHITKWQN